MAYRHGESDPTLHVDLLEPIVPKDMQLGIFFLQLPHFGQERPAISENLEKSVSPKRKKWFARLTHCAIAA